ncbi:hypothetical protein CKAH01_03695 [Colletotrichum kahawae]|uniref:Uncharacterized protein n=1 Tax=Colletotrichum kahawae TaxID=34407 RepID=A0AAD9YQL5_COLKA|nr:hypothetical protein CKAH01_03695 [Colletotrichum kahawae]
MVLAVVTGDVDGKPLGELVVAEFVVDPVVEPKTEPGPEPEEDSTGLMTELVGVTKLELDDSVSPGRDTALDEDELWKLPTLVDVLCDTEGLPVICDVAEVEEELVSWKVVDREVEMLEDMANVALDDIGL